TAILDRMCGALCDALLHQEGGQATLAYLEHTNLVIVPLANERQWYRYHHLFAELLRQRLHQFGRDIIKTLHQRASQWYEENGFDIDAFHHAVAAHDIDRAARLVEGDEMPLPFRGAALPILKWLEGLPKDALDNHPFLWVINASTLLFFGQLAGVEQKL